MTDTRTCMNCGASLPREGRHCPMCGQDHRWPQLRFLDVARGAVGDLFDVDGPFLRTIRDLTWRPGHVAAAYVDGKRRTYTNPAKYCFIMGALASALMNSFVVNEGFIEDELRQITSEDSILLNKDVLPLLLAFLKWSHLWAVASLPILAAVNRLFFPKSGRTVMEHYVVGLYAYGHAYLLQGLVAPIGLLTNPITSPVLGLLPFIYFSWTTVTFCRTSKVWGVVRSVISHAIYAGIQFGVLAGAAFLWVQFRGGA